jgi:hypothetical protein
MCFIVGGLNVAFPKGRTAGGHCALCSTQGLIIHVQVPGTPNLYQSYQQICLVVLKLVNETSTFVLIVIDDSIIGHACTCTKAAFLRDQRCSQWQ